MCCIWRDIWATSWLNIFQYKWSLSCRLPLFPTKGCWTMWQAQSVMFKTAFNPLHKLKFNTCGLGHCCAVVSCAWENCSCIYWAFCGKFIGMWSLKVSSIFSVKMAAGCWGIMEKLWREQPLRMIIYWLWKTQVLKWIQCVYLYIEVPHLPLAGFGFVYILAGSFLLLFFLIIYDQWAVLKEVRSVGAFREGLYAPDRQLMTPKVTTSCSYIPFLSVNL